MYQLPRLQNIPGLIHGFSEKSEGNMSFKWGKSMEEVVAARKIFLEKLVIPISSCVTMSLAHGSRVVRVRTEDRGKGMTGKEGHIEADALSTNEPDVFLFLLTADCLPVILYDPIKKAVALAHASRINAAAGISAKAIEHLGREYGSKPRDIIAGIGPAIHKESYIFPSETIGERGLRTPEWAKFLTDFPDGRTAIDLIGFNFQELVDAGVREANIEISDELCY